MKRSAILCFACVLALLLTLAFPVAADEVTTTTTTTTTAAPTTTTAAAPTTTTVTTAAPTTTVTTVTTTVAVTTAAPAPTTTAVQAVATTVAAAPVVTTANGTTVTTVTDATGSTVSTVTETTTTETTTEITTTTTRPTTAAVTLPFVTGDETLERIDVVTEPGMSDEKVYFYDSGNKVDEVDFTWGEGRRNGQALVLNGEGQYLRYSAAKTLLLEEFTLSMWVNHRNGVDGQKWLTVYKNETRFFTASPYMSNPELGVNGVYLEACDRTVMPDPAFVKLHQEGHVASPAPNEWHHVAITLNSEYLTLYMDGGYYLSVSLEGISIDDMDLNAFLIGGGFHDEPTLAASLDDVFLYDKALTPDQIALLASDIDPAVGGYPTGHATYIPTRPATSNRTTVNGGNGEVPHRATLFGLPPAVVLIPVVMLAVVIALSVVLSNRKKDEEETVVEENEARPTIGEPEAPQDEEDEEVQE